MGTDGGVPSMCQAHLGGIRIEYQSTSLFDDGQRTLSSPPLPWRGFRVWTRCSCPPPTRGAAASKRPTTPRPLCSRRCRAPTSRFAARPRCAARAVRRRSPSFSSSWTACLARRAALKLRRRGRESALQCLCAGRRQHGTAGLGGGLAAGRQRHPGVQHTVRAARRLHGR